MAKSVLVVLLDKPQDQVNDELVRRYGDGAVFAYTETVYFVETGALPSQVRRDLMGEGKATGAIFRVDDTFSGYTSRDLWTWLQDTVLRR